MKVSNEEKIIKRSALKLLSTEGFMARYEAYIAEHPNQTFKTAYEKIEKEFLDAFEINRYSSYINFRNARSQYLKRVRPQTNESKNKRTHPNST